jgi:hypothetical protein
MEIDLLLLSDGQINPIEIKKTANPPHIAAETGDMWGDIRINQNFFGYRITPSLP